jgi:hypothetical protein
LCLLCGGAVCLQRRAGPKGHGLYTEEDLAAGQFVIQYVGEVLEEEEYLRRKHYYIQTGQRHYYFMNIGNGEVIDACRKVISFILQHSRERAPQSLLRELHAAVVLKELPVLGATS